MRKKMEEAFRKATENAGVLEEKEKTALLDMYSYVLDAAEIGALEEVQEMRSQAMGAIEFLYRMGKILDAEDLHMLLNEIEEYGYRIAKGEETSPWDAQGGTKQ